MPSGGWKETTAPGRKFTPSIFRSRFCVPCGADAGVSFVIAGIARTCATSVDTSLPGFESVSCPTIDTELTSVPARVGVPTIVIVAVCPSAMSPRSHVTTAPPEHEPALEPAEDGVNPGGSTSITETPFDGPGPWFVATIV